MRPRGVKHAPGAGAVQHIVIVNQQDLPRQRFVTSRGATQQADCRNARRRNGEGKNV
jgi:hypothetical protein